VATINQADTAWILISTGTSPNARPPAERGSAIASAFRERETPRKQSPHEFAGKPTVSR
jgi:hypothetical protein